VLATAVHIGVLDRVVFVLAFAAIELVPPIIGGDKKIVAIPAIHDILSFTCEQAVFAVASVEDSVTRSCVETVSTAKATYLVIAMLRTQQVWFVGA